jgi:hypothetical protein
MTDFRTTNRDTIVMIEPLTETARTWLVSHVKVKGRQWKGNQLCVHYRNVYAIFVGILEAGFSVENEKGQQAKLPDE